MHQQKNKKILIYFLLFLLVGSINNIKITELRLSDISSIKILGLGTENNNFLLKNVQSLELGNIFFLNKKKLQKMIESNDLVEKYDIFKIYPSSLYINIKKTKFLARTNRNGENLIIGSNGKFIKNNLYGHSIPFIFGNPKIKEFLKFKEYIDNSKFKYYEIKNLYFFASGRWDVEFLDGLIIKLPEKNIKKSLELLSEFVNDKNFKNVKLVDLRINNQIILDD